MVDHLRGWYRDKKLIAFTLEPYHEVDADAFRAASQAMAEDDLVMSVCSCCAVYYPVKRSPSSSRAKRTVSPST
jgi:hypothetical protein